MLRVDRLKKNVIRDLWDRAGGLPGGKRLFSRAIGVMAPYSGSIGAQVEELARGHARVSMADRRAVRQHLGSVHAVALVNLAELCGNLAVAYSLPDGMRFIVAGLSIEYVKKARGRITASCDLELPALGDKVELAVPVTMADPRGDVVARATLRTLVGRVKG